MHEFRCYYVMAVFMLCSIYSYGMVNGTNTPRFRVTANPKEDCWAALNIADAQTGKNHTVSFSNLSLEEKLSCCSSEFINIQCIDDVKALVLVAGNFENDHYDLYRVPFMHVIDLTAVTEGALESGFGIKAFEPDLDSKNCSLGSFIISPCKRFAACVSYKRPYGGLDSRPYALYVYDILNMKRIANWPLGTHSNQILEVEFIQDSLDSLNINVVMAGQRTIARVKRFFLGLPVEDKKQGIETLIL